MSNTPPALDRGSHSPNESTSVSRRGVLRTAGVGLAGAGLAGVPGSTSADQAPALPRLVRDGNRLVDPQEEPVTLRGVNVADPAEQARDWRGMDAGEVLDLATAHPDWYNTLVRVPITPQFAASGDAGAQTPAAPVPSDLPHGDEWGPVLPGTFDAAALEAYLAAFVDDLVARAAENGAYLMLEYHRERPVFYHREYRDYVQGRVEFENRDDVDPFQFWDCQSDDPVDHSALSNDVEGTHGVERTAGVCGERGVLWHGADQKDALLALVDEQEPWEYFSSFSPGAEGDAFESIDDVFLEPDAVCHALDEELRLFWEVVADRYATADHVLFDVYGQPGGPYAGDWGSPDRAPGGANLLPSVEKFELDGEYAKPYYDLWVERSQPWMDVVENYGTGQPQTIGNPRFSQYQYWAPYNEYGAENVCYGAQVHLQESCRPLEETIGQPSEYVPLFLTDFGWQDFDLFVPTPWMTLEAYDGIEFAEGDENGKDPFGSLAFWPLLETYDVHPICGVFDHTWAPNFFEHGVLGEFDGAPVSDHWYDEGYLIDEETPGEWWRQYVEGTTSDDDYQPNVGTIRHPVPTGPNELHCDHTAGYAAWTLADADNSFATCSSREDQCSLVDAENGQRLENEGWVCDVDGDGHYRDLTASGETTVQDLQHFFEHQHREPYDSRTDLFDYTGNDDVGQPDVVDLFHEI